MSQESWLVKKDRIWGMGFFLDKNHEEDGTCYMRVKYASCKHRFLHGITPQVQLRECEKMTYERPRELWNS